MRNTGSNEGFASGDVDEQSAFLQRGNPGLCRTMPPPATTEVHCGALRGQRCDLEGALQDFNEAIRPGPDDAAAFNNRGNARPPPTKVN